MSCRDLFGRCHIIAAQSIRGTVTALKSLLKYFEFRSPIALRYSSMQYFLMIELRCALNSRSLSKVTPRYLASLVGVMVVLSRIIGVSVGGFPLVKCINMYLDFSTAAVSLSPLPCLR